MIAKKSDFVNGFGLITFSFSAIYKTCAPRTSLLDAHIAQRPCYQQIYQFIPRPKLNKKQGGKHIMALVDRIFENKRKSLGYSSHTQMEYNMNRMYFAVWTYREKDTTRTAPASQNILIDKEKAIQLRDAFNQFIQML
jgi:hypothetical protein